MQIELNETRNSFLSQTSSIPSAQQPHVVNSYHIRQYRLQPIFIIRETSLVLDGGCLSDAFPAFCIFDCI